MKRRYQRWASSFALAACALMTTIRAEAQAGGCQLSGYLVMPLGTELFDARAGGTAFARFTGRPVAIVASDFSAPRASLSMGDGTDGVSLSAFVAPEALTVNTRREVVVVPQHLWIAAGEPIQVLATRASELQVRLSLVEPVQVDLDGRGPCEAFGLGAQGAVRRPILDRASAVISRAPELVVYEAPTAPARTVTTLRTSPRFVLWAVQDHGQFFRVRYSGPFVLDGWVHAADVEQVSEATVYSVLVNPEAPSDVARLEQPFADSAPRVMTRVAVPIHLQPDGPVIASFEPGTAVRVLEVANGWASVLPERVEVAPLDQQRFWAATADLGL